MSNLIKNAKLQHVALKCEDIQRTIDFYVNGLGFKLSERYGGAAKIEIDEDTFLELFAKETDSSESDTPLWHFAIQTDDCEGALEIAKNAGAKVVREPSFIDQDNDNFPTRKFCFCSGPDNEIIEFIEHLS